MPSRIHHGMCSRNLRPWIPLISIYISISLSLYIKREIQTYIYIVIIIHTYIYMYKYILYIYKDYIYIYIYVCVVEGLRWLWGKVGTLFSTANGPVPVNVTPCQPDWTLLWNIWTIEDGWPGSHFAWTKQWPIWNFLKHLLTIFGILQVGSNRTASICQYLYLGVKKNLTHKTCLQC